MKLINIEGLEVSELFLLNLHDKVICSKEYETTFSDEELEVFGCLLHKIRFNKSEVSK